MQFLTELFHTLRHLNPDSVAHFAQYVGPWLYVVLFAIVFCETGFVVTPFLPGDSLLFTVGAFAQASGIHLFPLIVLLCLAANCGDLVNYFIGYRVGPKVFQGQSSLLNRKHLLEAQQFYEKHGRKTIIIARFVPIIRTFAPFVAGVGKMPFTRFLSFSVLGGILWVTLLTFLGYQFGRIDFVKKHYELVILAIVAISLVPVAMQIIASRSKKPAEAQASAFPVER